MGISDVTASVPVGFGQNGDGFPLLHMKDTTSETGIEYVKTFNL